MIAPSVRVEMHLHRASLVQQRIEKDRADRLAAYDALRRGEKVQQQPAKVKA